MKTWHLFLLGILPVLLLAVYVYQQDKNQREPVSLLLRAFGQGVMAVPLVLLVHGFFSMIGVYQLFQQFVFTKAFLSAALVEEGTKYYLLYRLIWRNREFDERFDGIVYASFVSLGFACVENLMYIFQYVPAEMALQTGVQRGLLAVPAHFLFGVIMGYYFGLARFSVGPLQSVYLCLSLLLAVVAHGCYDWFLMFASFIEQFSPAVATLVMLCFYAFDIALWRFALRRMRRHQEADRLMAQNDWSNIQIFH